MPVLPPAQPTSQFTNPAAMQAYIVAKAQALGLDPRAVLAVAAHEGVSLPAQVGDNGTSFGPWQMHFGGVYPSDPRIAPQDAAGAQAWANSPAGVDYALTHMASVAQGRTGADAVRNIVYRFERPADPASETTNALRTYQQGAGPSLGGGGGSSLGSIAHDVNSGLRHIPGVAQVEGVASGVSSVADFLGKLTDPHYILRGLQVVAGAVLVLAGVVLLTRQVALAADLPDPVGLAATAASKGAVPPVE